MGVREYELVVDGELSDDAAPAFDGLRLERRNGTTALVGRIRDQAELQGFLTRISDLGLTLLSATSHRRDESRRALEARRPRGRQASLSSAALPWSLTSPQRTISA